MSATMITVRIWNHRRRVADDGTAQVEVIEPARWLAACTDLVQAVAGVGGTSVRFVGSGTDPAARAGGLPADAACFAMIVDVTEDPGRVRDTVDGVVAGHQLDGAWWLVAPAAVTHTHWPRS